VVSAKGVHTNPNKIKAVSLLAEPQNVEQVISFLGLVGCYRQFIPKFASYAAPLLSPTEKGTKLHWCKEHSESFLLLKTYCAMHLSLRILGLISRSFSKLMHQTQA